MEPFGRCMEAICTRSEPYGSQIAPFGRRMAPYGSCICCMGPHAPNRSCRHCMGVRWHHMGAAFECCVCCMEAGCTVLEADGAIWEPHAQCGDHVGAMCTMLAPCAPCWSHVCHVGARWCRMGGNCHQMGAAWLPNEGHMGVACTVWEPPVAYGSWMEPYGRHVGAASTRWEPHEPYGSHMQHTGPYGLCVQRWMAPLWELHTLHGGLWAAICAVWELCAPFGSQVEPYGRWLPPYGSCMHCMGAIG
jgi:hypothetical protein